MFPCRDVRNGVLSAEDATLTVRDILNWVETHFEDSNIINLLKETEEMIGFFDGEVTEAGCAVLTCNEAGFNVNPLEVWCHKLGRPYKTVPEKKKGAKK